MLGLKYFRLKSHLKMEELAELSGVTKQCIWAYENAENTETFMIQTLLPLAKALQVTLDELVADYDAEDLEDGDHYTRPTQYHDADNPYARLKKSRNLSFRELGKLMGITRQAAQGACKTGSCAAKSHRTLLESLGMSQSEFEAAYGCAWEGADIA